MDTKNTSTAASNGGAGELQLSNQLDQSRSPYVSSKQAISLHGQDIHHLQNRVGSQIFYLGSGPHEQSGCLADVDARDTGPSQKA